MTSTVGLVDLCTKQRLLLQQSLPFKKKINAAVVSNQIPPCDESFANNNCAKNSIFVKRFK